MTGSAGERPGDDALVVVSPHLDDAVLAAWGTLVTSAGALVITVFAGVPDDATPPSPYDRLTRATSPRQRVLRRREEDRSVVRSLGAHARHLDLLEAAYRGEPYPPGLVEDEIDAALPASPRGVVLPAGIGSHPDHATARDAALQVLNRRGHDVVTLYADMPYAAYYGWPEWVTGLASPAFLDVDAYYARALDSLPPGRLGEPQVRVLTADEQARKAAAMRGYATQLAAMEGGPSRWLTHPDRLRYEVGWELSPAT